MTALRFLPVLMLALASAPGQQLILDIPPSSSGWYGTCYPFSDFNRDGVSDLIAHHAVPAVPARIVSLRILSGLNGSLLYQHPNFYGDGPVGRAGDFDSDGYDEYHWTSSGVIHVNSARRGVELFTLPPAGNSPGLRGDYGYAREPRIDLDGDGRSDFLVATVTANNSSVFAYNHLGALVYTIPVLIRGWVVRSLANVGDRDGDGGEDFLAGAMGGAQNEGAVFLVSGRTGTVLRIHFGLQPNDMIGGKVMEAGDLDRDGVTDFLGSNEISSGNGRQITVVWSGATGAVIQFWADPNYQLGDPVSAKHDMDMDGVPDLLMVCPACRALPAPSYYGMVKVISSRDGWMLQETHPVGAQGHYGGFVADLGVRPGNPHPVYVIAYDDQVLQGGRLEFWRSEPPRSSLSGTGCATSGTSLVPGLRTTPNGSRLQLANAPPGALAWCILGDGNATATSGYPLPVALDSLGFAGCSLLVPMDYVGVTTTGTVGIDRGYAAFDLPVALAATAGRRFAVQWLVLDPVTGFEAWTSRRDFWVQ